MNHNPISGLKPDTHRKIRSVSATLWLCTLCLMLILSGCSDHKSGQPASTGKPAAKALPVKIASVVLKDMPVELRAVGSAEAFARVEIRSQVSGLLEKVAFKEGDLIKQGDLLFRIDPRPFASRLEQAAATLAKDRVDLENARKQAKRYLPAAEKGYVSIEQSDAAQTSAASLEATLIADEAALKNARIELDNCTILSPLSGYSGELFVDPGTLIKANDQILVTINQVSPIKVSFTLPEQALPEIKKHLMANDMTVIVDSAGSPLTGKLNFVDNQVNQTTGTIRLKAIFNNDDHQLWPGEFINVRLRLTTMKDASVVPTRAIQASQTGDFVYVVKNDQTVEQRPVSVGFSVEDQTVINSGLEPGETVVTDGQLRLRAGALVQALDEPATNVPAKAAP